MGFHIKIFTLNSEYYNNTVGVILTAAILYDFLFRASISFNMMFLENMSKTYKFIHSTYKNKRNNSCVNSYCYFENINWINSAVLIAIPLFGFQF